MGLALDYGGVPLDMDTPPSTDDLLALGMGKAALSLEALRAMPDQRALCPVGEQPVLPARAGADARLQLDPPGVLDELREVAAERVDRTGDGFPFRLTSRRMRDVNGSIGIQTPTIRARNRVNPLNMNPADMARLGLDDGDLAEIRSADGLIHAAVRSDPTMRERVVSMTHNWGGLDNRPDAYPQEGASTNVLISMTRGYEQLNAMPRMTAIPVAIRRIKTLPAGGSETRKGHRARVCVR
jgi:anaerobic selenocysteine-containing dehydrogenase